MVDAAAERTSTGPLEALGSVNADTASDAGAGAGGTPFVTISDVLKRMNDEIGKVMPPSKPNCAETGGSEIVHPHRGRFELQTRLSADGSAARPATQDELRSADAETMLHQAACHVATLTSWPQKLAWATQQRRAGNQLYESQQYQAALDVYLTCLTVAAVEDGQSEDKHHENGSSLDALMRPTTTMSTLERWILFGQVLNNLALCTHQLGWHKKTIHFCTIAIDYYKTHVDDATTTMLATSGLSNNCSSSSSDISNTPRPAPQSAAPRPHPSLQQLMTQVSYHRCKFHYLRARAHRLRGDYALSRTDLQAAKSWLLLQEQHHGNNHPLIIQPLLPVSADSETVQEKSNRTNVDCTDDTASLHRTCMRAIQREEQLLQRAVATGSQNQKRQQQALQEWLQSTSANSDTKGDGSVLDGKHSTDAINTTSTGRRSKASPIKESRVLLPVDCPKQPRTYSTIRAVATTSTLSQRHDEPSRWTSPSNTKQSMFHQYWHMYWQRIGQQAQRLIDWIDEREEQRRNAKEK